VQRAVDARAPPLAAQAHRRAPAWRDGLAMLLGRFDSRAAPAQASAVVAHLRDRSADDVEALADDVLHGRHAAAEAGMAVYVTAALQVYFTRLAAALPAPVLRLLPERGRCPCCGSTPAASVVRASGPTPGARYLHCSLCATAWNHTRAVCIACGESRSLSLRGIEGDSGLAKAETCGACHRYTKVLYQARDPKMDPFADDLATMALDLLVAEAD